MVCSRGDLRAPRCAVTAERDTPEEPRLRHTAAVAPRTLAETRKPVAQRNSRQRNGSRDDVSGDLVPEARFRSRLYVFSALRNLKRGAADGLLEDPSADGVRGRLCATCRRGGSGGHAPRAATSVQTRRRHCSRSSASPAWAARWQPTWSLGSVYASERSPCGALLATALSTIAVAPGKLLAGVVAAVLFATAYNILVAIQGLWSTRIFAQPARGLAAIMSATSVGFLAGPLLAAPLDQGTAFLIAAALLAAAGALGVTAPQWRRRELTQVPGAQRGIDHAIATMSCPSSELPTALIGIQSSCQRNI